MLFSQLRKKSFLLIIVGNFNARSWWSLDKQSKEGDSLFLISSTSRNTQLIDSTTHIIRNSSSCITSNGVHASLHNNCHHQITFAHTNHYTEYPPPNHRFIWDYSNVDTLNIRKFVSSINWSHLFFDNHIDIQVWYLKSLS